MASIVVCCVPAQGHMAPLLAIAAHLVGVGHDVRFIGGNAYADRIRSTGAAFLPLPPSADLDLDHANEAFPERAQLSGIREVQWSMTHLFVAPAAEQFRAIEAALDARPADIVLADTGTFGAFLYCARPRDGRPPLALVNIGPLQSRDHDTAPFGLGVPPARGVIGRLRNRLLGAFVDRTVYPPIMTAFAKAFSDAGIAMPTGMRFGDLPGSLDRVIQLTVPEFEYPRPSMPDTVRFIGPITSAVPSRPDLPEWWAELDGGRPIIHVSQGTVANDDLRRLIRPTIDALAGEDVLLVVATGGRDIRELGPLPANARAAEFVPYDALFPRLGAFVTNGGYGGLHHALAHGVPIVVAGRTEDKVETSARVAWAGVGIDLRTQTPKPAVVRRAVRRVLADPGYREASARLGARIAAAPGLAGVEAVIEELLPSGAAGTKEAGRR